MEINYIYIWAWLSVWLSWLWVALWQWILAKTSIEILGKNPKIVSSLRIFTILWIALVESAAIYGLIVGFQILTSNSINGIDAISAWLAIWITAFGTWIWEWKLVSGALYALNRNPENKNTTLQFMILFVALIEVISIYGLIVAQKIIEK